MSNQSSLYLLTIRGRLAAATLDAARDVHNQTAGAPANIAAAQGLGDVSHMVYVPVPHDGHAVGKGAGEFLVMDLWNNLEGLNTFFADPHVQQGGEMIFSERDPVVWAEADGFTSFHIPAPYGKNERLVTTVRGTLKSRAEAQKLHNISVSKTISKGRKLGMLSHETYFRLAAPGSAEALEFFGVDVWMSADGLGDFYSNEDFLACFNEIFTAEAADALWVHPKGDWVEW